MEGYSIAQVSKKLNISKDALRYYDKEKLVTPTRGENKYRYYSQYDILNLMYLQVMRYADFSLDEIKRVMLNRSNYAITKECSEDTVLLLEHKRQQTLLKISAMEKTTQLLDTTIDMLKTKNQNQDVVNKLVTCIYNDHVVATLNTYKEGDTFE